MELSVLADPSSPGRDAGAGPAGAGAPASGDRRSPYDRVEAALTTLVRAVHRVPLHVEGAPALERASYALLGRLCDDGPMRHGALATCFNLDPSTVSRQVQGLEEAGLVVRRPDPLDRRAGVIELTPAGREALLRTRRARREAMHQLLADWSERECSEFADALERINDRLRQLKQSAHAHPAADHPAGPGADHPAGPAADHS